MRIVGSCSQFLDIDQFKINTWNFVNDTKSIAIFGVWLSGRLLPADKVYIKKETNKKIKAFDLVVEPKTGYEPARRPSRRIWTRNFLRVSEIYDMWLSGGLFGWFSRCHRRYWFILWLPRLTFNTDATPYKHKYVQHMPIFQIEQRFLSSSLRLE